MGLQPAEGYSQPLHCQGWIHSLACGERGALPQSRTSQGNLVRKGRCTVRPRSLCPCSMRGLQWDGDALLFSGALCEACCHCSKLSAGLVCCCVLFAMQPFHARGVLLR
jgi:hypothetical protein